MRFYAQFYTLSKGIPDLGTSLVFRHLGTLTPKSGIMRGGGISQPQAAGVTDEMKMGGLCRQGLLHGLNRLVELINRCFLTQQHGRTSLQHSLLHLSSILD